MGRNWKDNYGGGFLKASDLPSPRRVKIKAITEEVLRAGERAKLVAELHDGGKWCLNSTNCAMLEGITGTEDPDRWVGKVVEIYNDPSVRDPSGKLVGGIRCRAAAKASKAAKQPEPEPVEDDVPFDDDEDLDAIDE